MQKQPVIKLLLLVYFVLNVVSRWNIVIGVNDVVTWLIGVASFIFLVFAFFFPRYIKYALFLFAFSFPLYGAGTLFTRAHVFEFLLCIQSLSLLIMAIRMDSMVIRDCLINRLLGIYLLYSCCSLLLFPVYEYSSFFNIETVQSALEHLLYENGWSFLYSIAGLNRLGLFIASALLLSCQDDAREILKWVFISMLAGAFFASVVGIIHQYGIVDLRWYTKQGDRAGLQSVFGHPGWFAEYMTITIPFILYGFLHRTLQTKWKILLFLVIIICEIAIIFSASRTSWLTYPLTLFICWLCFYWQKNRVKGWMGNKKILWKVAISFPITILISIAIIVGLVNHSRSLDDYEELVGQKRVIGISGIESRLSRILSPSFRAHIGEETFSLIKESPVFGLGYESYGWHASILSKIPESDFYKNRKTTKLYGTPHNFYLSLLVSGGGIGLLLWFSVIAVVFCILLSDLILNNNTDSLPVLLCIFAFHQYGLGQSMQYVPVIWFTIFMCLCYVMTIHENILPERIFYLWKKWIIVCVLVTAIGGMFYVSNLQSWRLAEKYGLHQYYDPTDSEQIHFAGFYAPRKSPVGMTRWMGKKGAIEIVDDGVMEFYLVCEHPDIEKEPVQVTIDINGKVIDELTFTITGNIRRQYFIPENVVGEKMNISVSRTWNPQKFGGKWGRMQGVAVSNPVYSSEIPENGIGFSVWERMAGQMPEWAKPDQQYRWSGKRATIRIDDTMQRKGFEIYLRSRHPSVTEKPVKVELFADDDFLETVIFSSSNWQPLVIGREMLAGKKALTFHVSRTWNPALMKISGDNRDLGIAVAVP